MFCALRCASTRTYFQQHWGRRSLYFALQVKLSEFMEAGVEFYSDINIVHGVIQNQLSQKNPQVSHVMSTPLSLMDSRSELSSDMNLFHRVVCVLCTVSVGRSGRRNVS